MSFLEPGPPLRVKICGLTNPVDADMALAAGADALGFNFYEKSKRHLDLEAARPWITALAGRTQRIAVVVNPPCANPAILTPSNSTGTKPRSFAPPPVSPFGCARPA